MSLYRECEITVELFGNKFSASGEQYTVQGAFDKWLKELDKAVERERGKKEAVLRNHTLVLSTTAGIDRQNVVGTLDAAIDNNNAVSPVDSVNTDEEVQF